MISMGSVVVAAAAVSWYIFFLLHTGIHTGSCCGAHDCIPLGCVQFVSVSSKAQKREWAVAKAYSLKWSVSFESEAKLNKQTAISMIRPSICCLMPVHSILQETKMGKCKSIKDDKQIRCDRDYSCAKKIKRAYWGWLKRLHTGKFDGTYRDGSGNYIISHRNFESMPHLRQLLEHVNWQVSFDVSIIFIIQGALSQNKRPNSYLVS